MKRTRRGLAISLALTIPLALSACGDDSGDDAASGSAPAAAPTSSAAAAETPSAAPTSSDPMASMSHSDGAMGASAPFGPGCAAVPKTGKGSFSGMAQDPVATAASNNPALSTLVSAVTKAGLGDTLNNAKDITVFAPTNDAFNKVPKATMDKAMGDPKGLLTTVLTGHVVPGRLSPDQVAGTHKTLAGNSITVEGSGESFSVKPAAKVVCGDVQTSNATVYIIDSVLLPAS
ncbi:fasciclin domain-containing protein [Luteipulveratus mongoliensis]|uniref:FAS1 domain-containing protein n=1 Tax=Luteipulveratus mongoliensis TaxID=571913 RepID=A0A0K1JLU6_9MICO|nr:fasciclin domain-containing protein [Luteipulveratus mongoliensis]AKU17694.1 hypothetical protein VV02_20685 [Luteipulveratus mongoliensis]